MLSLYVALKLDVPPLSTVAGSGVPAVTVSVCATDDTYSVVESLSLSGSAPSHVASAVSVTTSSLPPLDGAV